MKITYIFGRSPTYIFGRSSVFYEVFQRTFLEGHKTLIKDEN